jgi:hypothetical protein
VERPGLSPQRWATVHSLGPGRSQSDSTHIPKKIIIIIIIIIIIGHPSYVLGLTCSSLLGMECNRWPDLPLAMLPGSCHLVTLSHLFRYALFTLRSHHGRLSLVKATVHSDDVMNNCANLLANLGHTASHPFDLSSLYPPPSWVDTALSHLVTRASILPLPSSPHLMAFTHSFLDHMANLFPGVPLDPFRYIHSIWSLHSPTGLQELLWKDATGSLPIRDAHLLQLGYFTSTLIEPCYLCVRLIV